MFSYRTRQSTWEEDRFNSLPKEERRVVQSWVWHRLSRTWQLWVSLLLIWTVTLGSDWVAKAIGAAGAGPFAVVGVWVACHAAYGLAVTRLLMPVYRQALREFLLVLETHKPVEQTSRET